MTWDLRTALLKKGETESARLDDFDYRLRARTMRLLGDRLGRDPAALVRAIATASDAAILAELASARPDAPALYELCRGEARTALIGELGDPAPHRLA